MLINFIVENFLSFKEQQHFSMLAGLGGKNKAHHVIPKAHSRDVRLVKTGIIYGANASGKSNLVKAMHFAKQLVTRGTALGRIIQQQPFKLDTTTVDRPTRMEFEIKHKGQAYAYGFIFDELEIKGEWLYHITRNNQRMLFERKGKTFDLEPLLKKHKNAEERQFLSFLAKGTPANQLFLTDIQGRNIQENLSHPDDLLTVFDWFKNALTIIYPDTKAQGLEFELQQNEQLIQIYCEFLRYFDTGIDDIALEQKNLEDIPFPEEIEEHIKSILLDQQSEKTSILFDNPSDRVRYLLSKDEQEKIQAHKLTTVHRVANGRAGFNHQSHFDIHEESDGTQRIMDFIPMLIDLFKGGNVIVVDELERSLHPNLVYNLLEMFLKRSKGISSQLIATSHSPALLTQELLRKDEIWFVDKDAGGASSISSLEEYEVRFDKQIRGDYLYGRYGAVPVFGNPYNLSVANRH